MTEEILAWLPGKRTYLIAAAIVCLSLLFWAGAIDQPTLVAWLGLLNGAGLGTLRLAVTNESARDRVPW